MIEIVYNDETNLLNLFIKNSQNFQESVENLKDALCKWNAKAKVWEKSPADFYTLTADLALYEELEFSELTKVKVESYFNSLKELKEVNGRVRVNWDLMNFKPLKGIAPNENYQAEDLMRALSQNRFLFNWEMGLGKSFALATLIENLRFQKRINKCLIFSTAVGVYNLKDELLKFGKNFKDEDILVLNSLSDTNYNDRDIFNIQKYPQSVIIMTYDSFKGVNNYYYDIAHFSPKLYQKIEKAEEECKALISSKKTELKSKNIDAENIKKILSSDKDILSLKSKIKTMKDKLHPSEKTKYKESYIPMKEWLQGQHGALFLDEVHSLANPESRRSELMKMNLSYFYYRYEFTGTLADKYEKLYMPIYILDKYLVEGRSYNDWLASYCELGNKWSRYAVNTDTWDMEKIQKLNKTLLNTYGSKRIMNECLDLPLDYNVPTINLDMSPLQRKIYESFTKEQLKMAQDRKVAGEATIKDTILNMFGIFQLAVDNPECIVKSESFGKLPADLQKMIQDYRYSKDSTKLEAVKAIVEEHSGENNDRGIIWYYHPITKDTLVKELAKYKPIVVEAGMNKDEISNAIKEFKENPEHKIIIGSINIMNTSVTLIECSYQCYIEKTYNYTVYSQSRGRIHRPNKPTVSKTYDFCYKHSIDSLQKENLETKGMTLNSLMNKGFITQSEWQKIFN